MCGRYTIRSPLATVVEDFGALASKLFLDGWNPRYNVAPSQDVPIVRLNAEGERVLSAVRWGLIPSWTKGKPGAQPINARAETVASSGMFRQAFERRRCLIPADGFYEWKKLDAKTKQPMLIHRRDDHLFAFAGLWERWRPSEDAEPIDTCTIITTTPNTLAGTIHNRMPVILDESDFARWLDRETKAADVADLLQPAADDWLDAYPVSTRVNKPANDDPQLIEPLRDESEGGGPNPA